LEVGEDGEKIRIRQSDQHETELAVPRAAFDHLISGVKAGEFDRPVEEGK
jgi:hypothetical protein